MGLLPHQTILQLHKTAVVLGLSRDAFAKRIGIGKRTLIRWEVGAAPKHALVLAELLLKCEPKAKEK